MSDWEREKQRNGELGDEDNFTGEVGQICDRCRQEYTGTCLLNIPDCPFEENEEDPFADEDDAGPDFEDAPNLKALLEEDKEAEKVIEEDHDDIPPEDLLDDEKPVDDTRG